MTKLRVPKSNRTITNNKYNDSHLKKHPTHELQLPFQKVSIHKYSNLIESELKSSLSNLNATNTYIRPLKTERDRMLTQPNIRPIPTKVGNVFISIYLYTQDSYNHAEYCSYIHSLTHWYFYHKKLLHLKKIECILYNMRSSVTEPKVEEFFLKLEQKFIPERNKNLLHLTKIFLCNFDKDYVVFRRLHEDLFTILPPTDYYDYG